MTEATTLVTYDVQQAVATITLDSPHNRNALSALLVTQLLDALDRAAADDEARMVLVRSADRVFCSGADLSEAAAGGMDHALACSVAARQPFAGYWEYLLENAIFTAPAHPHWGGAGLFGPDGTLCGIGSLILQHGSGRGKRVDLNMVVPVAPLLPILETLRRTGVSGRPVPPWLGLYATEDDDAVGVGSLAKGGPAERAGVKPRDRDVAVGGVRARDLGPEPRHRFRHQPAAAADVEDPQPLERARARQVARELRRDLAGDVVEPGRVQHVQGLELALHVPPLGGHRLELLDLGRIDAGSCAHA